MSSGITASLRRRMIGPTMAFVALLAVGSAVPAHAASAATPVAASAAGHTASIGGPVQSLEVSGDATTITVKRDGYTSAPAPKPKPAVKPAAKPVVKAAAKPAAKPAPKPAAAVAAVKPWSLPTSGRVSSVFGPRIAPVPGVNPFHKGTDIAAPFGQAVRAAHAGTVVEAGFVGSYGNWVLIDHGDGIQTGYAHSSKILVGVGQHVAAGAAIALVGSTGASTGAHVHFEVRVGGAQVNPQPFMSSHGVRLG